MSAMTIDALKTILLFKFCRCHFQLPGPHSCWQLNTQHLACQSLCPFRNLSALCSSNHIQPGFYRASNMKWKQKGILLA